MFDALAEAIETRDPHTRGHSARVTTLAYAVARRLGWGEELLDALRLGGTLHDVGKLAVSAHVLRKPGPLTEAEREHIQQHPSTGARLVRQIPAARPALPCVLFHHERWDGDGYPTGRARTEIPLQARLLAIADAFDAMTSDRPYRARISFASALDEVDRCAGSQFDPVIARVFVDVLDSRGVPAALAS